MKLRSLAAVVAALSLGSGAVLAQSAAPAASTAAPADKPTLSYALGYEFGSRLAGMKADVDVNTLIRAVQDGYGKKDPTLSAEKLNAALQQFEEKVAADQKAEFDRVVSQNRAKSNSFLAANKAKTGVVVLPSGIQYRVIDAGAGAKPTAASTVRMKIRGLLPSGQAFIDTANVPNGPEVEVKMSDLPPVLPPSIKDVLMMMGSGSRWEIVVPPEKAFGDSPRSPIGPAQAVLYEISIVSVK